MKPIRAVPALPLALWAGLLAAADESDAPPPPSFERDVLPILEECCFECHGGRERVKGGLRLTSREGVLAGGGAGPAVDLQHPGASLLLRMVRYDDPEHGMPPRGRLPDEEVRALTRWVDAGVPWAGEEDYGVAPAEEEDDAVEPWPYGPVVRPAVPAVSDEGWVRNPIDAFVLARLEAEGVPPAPPADAATLLRRVTFDLTGLPPTPEDVRAFAADPSDVAYEAAIERLLASPRYGERWARHWLDVVRYAETNGFERDTDKPFIWRYRDWVIDAFDDDVPYDRFVMEQLAGDELDEVTPESLVATGYQRLMQWDDEPGQGALQARYDTLDDLVSTTAQAFLGVTIGCARCHDHVKDPIPQADYYRFMAFFHGLTDLRVDGPLVEIPTAAERAELDRIEGREDDVPRAFAVTERGGEPEPLHVHVRGSAHALGERVEPAFPSLLAPPPADVPTPAADAPTSGRRRVLAEWIASEENPMTARVMLNRIWQHHLGRGIVGTPNDFGGLGEGSTHPALLDWLAAEFVARGWSVKAMHRLILTSATYRMSSHARPAALERDPENHLFSRFELRRLSAEEMRDTMIAMTGRLNEERGGPPFHSRMPQEALATSSRPDAAWGTSPEEETFRRSIYIKVKRSLLTPFLVALDLADTDQSCPERFTTTQPTQALTMINGEFVHEMAELFAARLRAEAGDDPAAQVRRAIALALGREASDEEVRSHVDFLAGLAGAEDVDPLQLFCLVVLNLNECTYVA